jgi:hypothetical protein
MSAPRPTGGYGANPDKQAWRHVAFQFSNDNALHRPKRDRVIACLDTAEGCEVRHALALGFHPANIHVFNDGMGDPKSGAAVLANMTRRLERDRLPRVQVHARSIADAAECVPGGALDILSLDFCGPLTEARVRDINRAARALRDGAVVMVNVQGAREADATFLARAGRRPMMVSERPRPFAPIRSIAWDARDAHRVKNVVRAVCASQVVRAQGGALGFAGCRFAPCTWRLGRYSSGHLPFVWSVFTVVTCDGSAPPERLRLAARVAREGGEPVRSAILYQARLREPFRCICDELLTAHVVACGDDAVARRRAEVSEAVADV